MDKETIRTYNLIAEAYAHETSDFWNIFPRTFIDNFKRYIDNGVVLDIGSGPGRDAQILAEAGLRVLCLDASYTMIRMTHDKGFCSVLADFTKLPFAEQSFNGVWAYTSLLHVPKSEVRIAIEEIRRVLKEGGIFGLGIIEGHIEDYSYTVGVELPRFFALYTQNEVARLLMSTNLEPFYFERFQPKNRNYLQILSRKI